jgi:hypothetical protein
LLGLTVGCAQCHDHRYDPISQEDYYALRAVFEPAFDWQQGWQTPAERLVSLSTDADRAKAAAIEADVNKIAAERAAKQAELVPRRSSKQCRSFQRPSENLYARPIGLLWSRTKSKRSSSMTILQ